MPYGTTFVTSHCHQDSTQTHTGCGVPVVPSPPTSYFHPGGLKMVDKSQSFSPLLVPLVGESKTLPWTKELQSRWWAVSMPWFNHAGVKGQSTSTAFGKNLQLRALVPAVGNLASLLGLHRLPRDPETKSGRPGRQRSSTILPSAIHSDWSAPHHSSG